MRNSHSPTNIAGMPHIWSNPNIGIGGLIVGSMKDINPTTIINSPMAWRVVDLRIPFTGHLTCSEIASTSPRRIRCTRPPPASSMLHNP